ncbi:MAG: hypothetical protein AUK47_29205 [Deltaproteobacteria bacterium CG2_30_63_29]|nr:MAG: hypothetical protein AUK47_29205 [Deltaproteobacteria bacterium CG2_30_63_29]
MSLTNDGIIREAWNYGFSFDGGNTWTFEEAFVASSELGTPWHFRQDEIAVSGAEVLLFNGYEAFIRPRPTEADQSRPPTAPSLFEVVPLPGPDPKLEPNLVLAIALDSAGTLHVLHAELWGWETGRLRWLRWRNGAFESVGLEALGVPGLHLAQGASISPRADGGVDALFLKAGPEHLNMGDAGWADDWVYLSLSPDGSVGNVAEVPLLTQHFLATARPSTRLQHGQPTLVRTANSLWAFAPVTDEGGESWLVGTQVSPGPITPVALLDHVPSGTLETLVTWSETGPRLHSLHIDSDGKVIRAWGADVGDEALGPWRPEPGLQNARGDLQFSQLSMVAGESGHMLVAVEKDDLVYLLDTAFTPEAPLAPQWLVALATSPWALRVALDRPLDTSFDLSTIQLTGVALQRSTLAPGGTHLVLETAEQPAAGELHLVLPNVPLVGGGTQSADLTIAGYDGRGDERWLPRQTAIPEMRIDQLVAWRDSVYVAGFDVARIEPSQVETTSLEWGTLQWKSTAGVLWPTPDGLWALIDNELRRFDGEQFVETLAAPSSSDGQPGYGFLPDPAGRHWALAESGNELRVGELYRYDPDTSSWSEVTRSGVGPLDVSLIARAPDGVLWAVPRNLGGVSPIWALEGTTWTSFEYDASVTHRTAYTIAFDGDGQFQLMASHTLNGEAYGLLAIVDGKVSQPAFAENAPGPGLVGGRDGRLYSHTVGGAVGEGVSVLGPSGWSIVPGSEACAPCTAILFDDQGGLWMADDRAIGEKEPNTSQADRPNVQRIPAP